MAYFSDDMYFFAGLYFILLSKKIFKALNIWFSVVIYHFVIQKSLQTLHAASKEAD